MFINVPVVLHNIHRYSISKQSHTRIQQFNLQFNDNRQLQIKSRHLSVSRCNKRVEYRVSHHFRDCSSGLADSVVLTMETSLEWPYTLTLLTRHSATIYMTNKSSSQATHYINNTT